jgi:hypothetical protein
MPDPTQAARDGDQLMFRGMQPLKQSDLTKAIKAAVKAGVKDWRVEVEVGKIIVVAGALEQDSGTAVDDFADDEDR